MNVNEAQEKERGRAGDGSDEEQEANAGEAQRDRQSSGKSAMGKGVVYFIETKDGRYIKIGYSTQAYRRIWQLGTLRPANYALRLIGWMPGTMETERWVQGKFSAHRDNGEWFRNVPEIRQFIELIGLLKPEEKPQTLKIPEQAWKPIPRKPEPAPVAEKRAIDPEVSKAAAAMGKKGGAARAKVLTEKRRKEIASKAAKKRWGGAAKP